MPTPISICWFRRDLRLQDNTAFFHALQQGYPVLPLFIFDKIILDKLEDKQDRRVEFIHASLLEMQQQLLAVGSTMEVYYGKPLEVFKQLAATYSVVQVFTNHDYEPYAKERDGAVEKLLQSKGIGFQTYKDQVIFEKAEVVKDDGKPYTVFTPYSRKWKSLLTEKDLTHFTSEKYLAKCYQQKARPIPSLASMGFSAVDRPFPSKQLVKDIINKYGDNRNYPAIDGTSRLGVHLRFGTISIRQLAKKSRSLSDSFLNELIWRDFYHMILWNFPQVGEGKAFRPEYDFIPWRNNEKEFEKWCMGMTGYPIVDAGMRELNATGFMHNRVRMIVASFLTKHLLIDWRWGEAWFAQKLLDFDFAANNGGWQWASGSGCDAAPYFRIFSPSRQTENFDKDLKYIRKWIPELDEFSYPAPMVDHDLARKRCMQAYGSVLKKTS
jgi:deoxyribodipyrimidine photo-lyase